MIVAALILASTAPSFDCGRAKTTVEAIICSDAQLSRMDRYVGERYAAERPRLRRDPRMWRTSRSLQRAMLRVRNRCETRDCIAETYKEMLHQWVGGPGDRFFKREDELGYLHVEELPDGWVIVDVFAYDRPYTEPGSATDQATTMLKMHNGAVEEPPSSGDICGFRMYRADDGWQIERRPVNALGCGVSFVNKTFAGHYIPRPFDGGDGGPTR